MIMYFKGIWLDKFMYIGKLHIVGWEIKDGDIATCAMADPISLFVTENKVYVGDHLSIRQLPYTAIPSKYLLLLLLLLLLCLKFFITVSTLVDEMVPALI